MSKILYKREKRSIEHDRQIDVTMRYTTHSGLRFYYDVVDEMRIKRRNCCL